ncbi:hypothetical protein [Cohnella sp. GCM10027633]|uniref:hypothetical protein n=1 Tax=unclassified Cohnella TaxID=2636738 RepID=UPI00363D91D8
MEYMIAGIVFGLCLFILPLWAYRRGLRDGLALNQGKTPEPIKTPVEAIIERREARAEQKETKAANDAFAEGFANLMSFDGSPQKKAGEA